MSHRIPLSHRGPLHWLTGCWHRVSLTHTVPGHGIADDWTTPDWVDMCCACLQTKPYYWGAL